MKGFGVIVIFSFFSFSLFAQKLTPKAIEDDLLKSFKRIQYWDEHKESDNPKVSGYDSLEKANGIFSKKLKYYTTMYPVTLNLPFSRLQKERLDIVRSKDGLLRIYGWDTWMGGTMHNFRNMIQYKSINKVYSILDTAKNNDDYIYFYKHIFTFKNNGETFYLADYCGMFSTKDVADGIRIYRIKNGKLDDVNLIKTTNGLTNKLYYGYDFFSVVDWTINGKKVDWAQRPKPEFDKTTQTITLPLVNEKDQVTHKLITYKFTGKYFEKVK